MAPSALHAATMVCSRCGTAFEGRFCPNCGTPAAVSAPAAPPVAPAAYPFAPPPAAFRCGRCGTLFSGKFCPACGLPAWTPWIPPPVPRGPPVLFVLLNIVWIFSLIAFLIVLGVAGAGMVGAIPPIASGISEIRSGATSDPGFDASPGPWTFHPWPIASTGSINASGGNPGPYAEMQLEGRQGQAVSGYWSQPVRVEGSSPYLAGVFLDYKVIQVSSILSSLKIAVYVEANAGDPPSPNAGYVWSVTLAQATGWAPAQSPDPSGGGMMDVIDVSTALRANGTYYVKVAVIATNQPGGGPGTPTIVGFDNVELKWWTNAWIDVAVYIPDPVLFVFTQDPAAFYAWTAALVAAVSACLAVLVLRDRRALWAALKAGAEKMPAKLRSRSAFVALAQTFLAVLFVSLVVAIFTQAPEPDFFSAIPLWYFVWSLLNASVYEELVFRVLMIGLPMMVGSVALRVIAALQGRRPAGTSAGRFLAGSLRYLYGGGISRNTSRGTLFPGLLLLVASSVIFGLAHAPGWGAWKVLPAAVAGLAMGYLFLRHGLAAAVAFHFATDMFVGAAALVGFDSAAGFALNIALVLVGLGLGAGFFAYYVLYVVRFAQDVARGPKARQPPSPQAPLAPPVYGGYPTTPAGPPLAYGGAASAPVPGPPSPVPPGYVPATRPPGYGTSPVEYRCPRCAWVEAAYENGRFRCLRCGYVG